MPVPIIEKTEIEDCINRNTEEVPVKIDANESSRVEIGQENQDHKVKATNEDILTEVNKPSEDQMKLPMKTSRRNKSNASKPSEDQIKLPVNTFNKENEDVAIGDDNQNPTIINTDEAKTTTTQEEGTGHTHPPILLKANGGRRELEETIKIGEVEVSLNTFKKGNGEKRQKVFGKKGEDEDLSNEIPNLPTRAKVGRPAKDKSERMRTVVDTIEIQAKEEEIEATKRTSKQSPLKTVRGGNVNTRSKQKRNAVTKEVQQHAKRRKTEEEELVGEAENEPDNMPLNGLIVNRRKCIIYDDESTDLKNINAPKTKDRNGRANYRKRNVDNKANNRKHDVSTKFDYNRKEEVSKQLQNSVLEVFERSKGRSTKAQVLIEHKSAQSQMEEMPNVRGLENLEGIVHSVQNQIHGTVENIQNMRGEKESEDKQNIADGKASRMPKRKYKRANGTSSKPEENRTQSPRDGSSLNEPKGRRSTKTQVLMEHKSAQSQMEEIPNAEGFENLEGIVHSVQNQIHGTVENIENMRGDKESEDKQNYAGGKASRKYHKRANGTSSKPEENRTQSPRDGSSSNEPKGPKKKSEGHGTVNKNQNMKDKGSHLLSSINTFKDLNEKAVSDGDEKPSRRNPKRRMIATSSCSNEEFTSKAFKDNEETIKNKQARSSCSNYEFTSKAFKDDEKTTRNKQVQNHSEYNRIEGVMNKENVEEKDRSRNSHSPEEVQKQNVTVGKRKPKQKKNREELEETITSKEASEMVQNQSEYNGIEGMTTNKENVEAKDLCETSRSSHSPEEMQKQKITVSKRKLKQKKNREELEETKSKEASEMVQNQSEYSGIEGMTTNLENVEAKDLCETSRSSHSPEEMQEQKITVSKIKSKQKKNREELLKDNEETIRSKASEIVQNESEYNGIEGMDLCETSRSFQSPEEMQKQKITVSKRKSKQKRNREELLKDNEETIRSKEASEIVQDQSEYNGIEGMPTNKENEKAKDLCETSKSSHSPEEMQKQNLTVSKRKPKQKKNREELEETIRSKEASEKVQNQSEYKGIEGMPTNKENVEAKDLCETSRSSHSPEEMQEQNIAVSKRKKKNWQELFYKFEVDSTIFWRCKTCFGTVLQAQNLEGHYKHHLAAKGKKKYTVGYYRKRNDGIKKRCQIGKRKFACDVCDVRHAVFQEFLQHYLRHLPAEERTIGIIYKVANSISGQAVMNGSKCLVCDRVICSKREFGVHMLSHKRGQTEDFRVVEERIRSRCRVIKQGREIYTCDVCQVDFVKPRYFTTHYLLHEKPRESGRYCKRHLGFLQRRTFVSERGTVYHKCLACDEVMEKWELIPHHVRHVKNGDLSVDGSLTN